MDRINGRRAATSVLEQANRMTGDQYVESILGKYAVPRGPNSPAEQLGAAVAAPLRTWAGGQLNALDYSGSYAKETGVHGVSDVDVFISLKADTTNTLKEIYNSLYSLAQTRGLVAAPAERVGRRDRQRHTRRSRAG